ncbi:protein phosphatase 2C domain-containing protein [uncultured Pseudoteredinibacter sp.]|uniref:PP2C family protein-serine/threonine phosphatase n=1 Tax=uncultured Pseudoteredinibacter sp. TaxID=1641701 RepID=UPI0026342D1F|nr:protein phosphatase 2C domain-containing protein [uncultured Pseudoteredinibacter sp.]
MQLSWTSRSHPGCVRHNNEDHLLCMGEQGLWLLADGMGGHEAGEVAAQLACQIVSQTLREGKAAKAAFELAHHMILEQSQGQQSAMGSTLICMQQLNKEQFQISWVGDSRAYRWRSNKLEQLSRDHSYVQSLIDAGQITVEQAREHPEKNIITQCLGAIEYDAIEVESLNSFWLPGDIILLCSDGLNDELHDKQIADILANDKGLQQQLLDLEKAALDAGGKDNISMIAISCDQASGYKNEKAEQERRPNQSEIANSLDFESNREKTISPIAALAFLLVFLILVSSLWFW